MSNPILLKNIRILVAGTPETSRTDLLIENGTIRRIAANIESETAELIDGNGAIVCPGFFDIGTQIGDPGFEHKEDLYSAASAAAAGGYTGLACFPNTHPVIHSKSEVLYVRNTARSLPVDIYPIGAISRNCEGKEITEMYDMRAAGAVAFSDGLTAIQHSGVLMRALLYVKPFEGLIINRPLDEKIAAHGMLHEGMTSTSLGLKAIPALAESLNVQREIYLTQYTESRLHFHLISAGESLDLIRKAKQEGVAVTASVSPLHLVFTDDDLMSFNNNLKVMPPIRSAFDRAALVEALKDGTIDVISSGHVPQDQESKHLEFAYAQFGAITLETTFSLLFEQFGESLGLGKLIDLLAIQPRQVLGLPVPEIKEGATADLCLIDLEHAWTRSTDTLRSKSMNDPLLGRTLPAKVLGTYCKGQWWAA
ncbi:MAG: dihydroorotase [Bacteroidota bacterium]